MSKAAGAWRAWVADKRNFPWKYDKRDYAYCFFCDHERDAHATDCPYQMMRDELAKRSTDAPR